MESDGWYDDDLEDKASDIYPDQDWVDGCVCPSCTKKKENKLMAGGFVKSDGTFDYDAYLASVAVITKKTKDRAATLLTTRTQKAKGVIALRDAGLRVPLLLGIVQSEMDAKLFSPITGPIFGRPCPKRPRHGFVDSKVIGSDAELATMLAETLAADPAGEVMLMNPIDGAKFNAIWTPTLFTIGQGNAGATEGVNTISIPLSGKMDELIEGLFGSAQIDPKIEDPYIELVQGGNPGETSSVSFFTQLRCGPKLGKATENFIPSDLAVSEVIQTDGQTLLEWEALMIAKAGTAGLVIYHPGGSLTDHFTVHARTFDIPVVLKGASPALGQTLLKESEDIPFSPSAILRGAVAGEAVKIPDENRSTYVSAMLVALYNSLSMTGEAGFWLGAAVSLMIRFGVAALKGEARHVHSNKGSGYKSKPWSIHALNREQIYDKWIPFSLSRHRAAVCRIISVLRYGDFGGSSGIGGENWAKCGVALIPLINDLGLLAREPSEDRVKSLIRSLNIAVDQAHNNGWWMNKFAYSTSFDAVQSGRVSEVAKAMDAFWQIDQAAKDVSTAHYEKRVGRWAEWKELKYEAPALQTAELSSFPGVPGMIFDVKSRLLGKAMRKVIVDPAKVKSSPTGNLYIIPNEDGGFAVASVKGSSISTLWSEEPLAPRKAKLIDGVGK